MQYKLTKVKFLQQNMGEPPFFSGGHYFSPEVLLGDETDGLTQVQMAELFGKGRTTITEHIQNVFKEGELSE